MLTVRDILQRLMPFCRACYSIQTPQLEKLKDCLHNHEGDVSKLSKVNHSRIYVSFGITCLTSMEQKIFLLFHFNICYDEGQNSFRILNSDGCHLSVCYFKYNFCFDHYLNSIECLVKFIFMKRRKIHFI